MGQAVARSTWFCVMGGYLNHQRIRRRQIEEELRRDQKWLARASDCVVQYWRLRNERKTASRGIRPAAPEADQLTPPAVALN